MSCNLCPHKCGVDRDTQLGRCQISLATGVPVAYSGLHYGEEPPISGTKGSGTLFFAGCHLSCTYCQNYQISQQHQTLASLRYLTSQELVAEMLTLQERGAHNINLVSPTHLLSAIIPAVYEAKKNWLKIPVVYNSNGYESLETIAKLKGIVDVYLPDYKYGIDKAGLLLSGVEQYSTIAFEAIKGMKEQVGNLKMNSKGVAVSGLLVRHLILPWDLSNSYRVLDSLATLGQDISISLMGQYYPHFRAMNNPEQAIVLTQKQYDDIIDYADSLDFSEVYIQELSSQEHGNPDFERSEPFDWKFS